MLTSVLDTFVSQCVSNQSLSRQIGEELRSSVRTQTDAMPQAPKSALWGWAPAGSKLGEVNFQAVILSSPQLIEHFAKTHSKGAWARHPTQSMEDYLSLLSRHLPSLDNDDLSGYLLRYNAVRFEEKDVSKRQYSKWLAHLTAILHTLDENALPALETLESEPLNRIIVEKQHKKRKKKRGK